MEESAFKKRNNLLQEAFRLNNNGPVDLQTLLALIREKSAQDKFLASMYFAGSIGDHAYFLKNDRFAIGLSVFPGDIEKAGQMKSHPQQTEIIIVLEGSIILEIAAKEVYLTAGDHYVIGKNMSHRILATDNPQSAYIFIKTNPASEKPNPKSNG